MFQALNAHHQEANCIDAASGILLSVAVHCTGCEITEFSPNLCTERALTERTIPDAASVHLAS